LIQYWIESVYFYLIDYISYQEMLTQTFSMDEQQQEAKRLYAKLKENGWNFDDCLLISPLTLEINKLKKEKNAVILAHSYQTPDIVFGVADFAGDSLGLSIEASKTSADMIIFAGVVFMAETAKILSPEKTVIVPSIKAGCSLADGVTTADVRMLKKKHPNTPVVVYVNSSAEVKAEADICVTSANLEKIVKNIKSEKIIFLPDKNMANYLRKITDKEIIDWEATCVVHDNIDPESVDFARERFGDDIIVLAHSECPPDVLDRVDLVGGTGDMINYIKNHPEHNKFMLATECGLADRLQSDFPDRQFVGSCVMCPYMKKNELRNILKALKNPTSEQFIEVPDEIRLKAKKSIDVMMNN
jgi:quinolinate synthase